MQIDAITPQFFEELNDIRAFFTKKNAAYHRNEAVISGLNLGFNTPDAPEIIKQNRLHLFDRFHLHHEWVAFANQVHGNRVRVVTKGGTFAETDALVTQVPSLALAIQVADCAAVLIADASSNTIAAVHAGWRGAAGDIIPHTLEKMIEIGGQPGNCRAFISPCISQAEFEVGREVAEQFPDQFVDYEQFVKPHINLKGFLKYQLQQAGLEKDSIEVHPGCTVKDTEGFYSYRREGDRSGRMMGIIQLKPETI